MFKLTIDKTRHKESSKHILDKPDLTVYNLIISVTVLAKNQIQIHYNNNFQAVMFVHTFLSEQEQLNIKELVADCNAEIYFLADGSVTINDCDPKCSLAIQTEGIIVNTSNFNCNRLKLSGRYLLLQHIITTHRSCFLSYKEQLENYGRLNVGTTFKTQGSRRAAFKNTGIIVIEGNGWFNHDSIQLNVANVTNYGLIYAKQELKFNAKLLYNHGLILSSHEIISIGKKLFNVGSIFSESNINLAYTAYMINTNAGTISCYGDMHLSRRDYHVVTEEKKQKTATLINQGKLIARNKLTAYNNAGIIFNEASGLLQGLQVDIGGTQFVNEGQVAGEKKIKVTLLYDESYWYNNATGRVATKVLDCVMERLINDGSIHAQKEFVSLLKTLHNERCGKIFSEQKLRVLALQKIINDCFMAANEELSLYSAKITTNEQSQLIAKKISMYGQDVAIKGEVVANINCTVVSKHLENFSSGYISAEQLKLAIEQEFSNRGYLQAARFLTITSSNKLTNNADGSMSAETLQVAATELKQDGRMTTQQEMHLSADLVVQGATSTTKSELSAVFIDGAQLDLSGKVDGKSIVLNGSQKASIQQAALITGQDQIEIKANQVVTAGHVQSKEKLQVEAYSYMQQEASGCMRANVLEIKAPRLDNAGVFKATNKVSLRIRVLNNLNNAVIECSNKLAIQSAELHNAGAIMAHKELLLKLSNGLENMQSGAIGSLQNLIIEVYEHIENSGLVTAKERVLIKIGNVLENTPTGIIQAKDFDLLGGWKLENFGTISADNRLHLKVLGTIHNYQSGKLVSEQAIELIGDTLDNCGEISSQEQLKLFIKNVLNNIGRISSTKAMDLIGAKLLLNAGEITSLENMEINSVKVLENIQTGKITAAEGFTAIAELLIENYGQLAANSIYLTATRLLLDGQIDGNELVGKAEIITSKGSVNSSVADLTADLIQIDGKVTTTRLNIEAKNYLLLLKDGKITCMEASKLLTKAGFVNLGKILTHGQLAIIANELFHDATASIEARHDLYLKAINLYLDGDLTASQNLFVLVENQFEYKTATLKANGELWLTLINGTQIKYNINTLGSLKIEFLTKTGTWYNEQQLQAGEDLIINIPGFIFVNGKSSKQALLQAGNVLTVDAEQVDLAQGQLKSTTLDMHTKSDLTINADQAKRIESKNVSLHTEEGSIEQHGQLKCTENLSIVASKRYGHKERELLNDQTVPQGTTSYDPLIYKWSLGEIAKYFEPVFVSGADGACALATIYKIIGSKEIGWQARIKAVQQLADNINDPTVRQLISSEVKGALLSYNDLLNLIALGFPISLAEIEVIGNFRTARQALIEEGTRLKIKYFSYDDLPIDGTNKSYAQLFLDQELDHYCKITADEKAQLQTLSAYANAMTIALDQLVDHKVVDYIKHVVAKSGVWLGVAGKSPGVMGAVAKINGVNFRVLSTNGSQDVATNTMEVVNICEQISDPNESIHHIHLQAETSDESEVQQSGWHFELLKETTDPKMSKEISEAKKATSTVTIDADTQAKNVTIIADGKVNLACKIEAEANEFIGSLCDDIEIKSIRDRRGNHENFDDYIIMRARVAAKNMLQLSAGGSIVFHAVETESGEGGTLIQALADILDVPIDLISQRVQHFYEKKKSGTIRDMYHTQEASLHKSKKNFASYAGGSSVFYSHTVDSKTATIASKHNTTVMNRISRHDHCEDLRGKKRRWYGGSKTTSSYSATSSSSSVGTVFKVADQLHIAGANVDLHHIHSHASHNIFSAPNGTVRISGGTNTVSSVKATSSCDPLWQKSRTETESHTTYILSTFTGTIEVNSQSLVLEVVSGQVLSFLKQITKKPEDVTYITLLEKHYHYSETHSAPGAGLVALAAVAIAVATAGTASGWSAFLLGINTATAGVGTIGTSLVTGSAIAAGSGTAIAHAAIAAGFTSICSQAAAALVANKGDFLKATKKLVSLDTIKQLAISMVSAGAMEKIGSSLPKPLKRNTPQHAMHCGAKASLDTGLNIGINKQKSGEAIKAGVLNACLNTTFAPVLAKIDGLADLGDLNTPSQAMFHAAIGAARSAILKDPNGILVGAVESVLPVVLGDPARKKQRVELEPEADGLEEQKKQKPVKQGTSVKSNYPDKAQTRNIEESSASMPKTKPLVQPIKDNGKGKETVSRNVKQAGKRGGYHREFPELQNRIFGQKSAYRDITDQHDLRASQTREIGIAEKVLDFFVPAAYADKLPTATDCCSDGLSQQAAKTELSTSVADFNRSLRDKLNQPKSILTWFSSYAKAVAEHDLMKEQRHIAQGEKLRDTAIKMYGHWKEARKEFYSDAMHDMDAYLYKAQGRLELDCLKALGNKFSDTFWYDLTSSTSIKTHMSRINKDKNGRIHYRNHKDGKFDKSPFKKAIDSFKSGGSNPTKIDGSLKFSDTKDYRVLDFLRSRAKDDNFDIETGGRLFFGGRSSVSSSVFGGSNMQNVGWFIRGSAGFNGASGTTETSLGRFRLDANGPSGSVNLGAKVNSDGKRTDISVEAGAKAVVVDVKGQIKSKKICTKKSCYIVEADVSASIGYAAKGGFGYSKDDERGTDRFTAAAALSCGHVPVMFGGNISVEREPNKEDVDINIKNNDSNIPSVSRPSP